MTRHLERVPTRTAAKHGRVILAGQRKIANERVLNPWRCRGWIRVVGVVGTNGVDSIQKRLVFKASLRGQVQGALEHPQRNKG